MSRSAILNTINRNQNYNLDNLKDDNLFNSDNSKDNKKDSYFKYNLPLTIGHLSTSSYNKINSEDTYTYSDDNDLQNDDREESRDMEEEKVLNYNRIDDYCQNRTTCGFTVSIVNNINDKKRHCEDGTSSYSSTSSSSYYDNNYSNSISNKEIKECNKIIIDVPLADRCNGEANFLGEHIYEELDKLSLFTEAPRTIEDSGKKSIFEGASKDEILEYLEDAKERVQVLIQRDSINSDTACKPTPSLLESLATNRRNRTSNVSNVSNSSNDSSNTASSSLDPSEDISISPIGSGQLVERNDSGVGTETSKPSKMRRPSVIGESERQCADCEQLIDLEEDEESGLFYFALVCPKCEKKRAERKEIISEFVDTELKYGRDLRIIREEFHRPMEVAGKLI